MLVKIWSFLSKISQIYNQKSKSSALYLDSLDCFTVPHNFRLDRRCFDAFHVVLKRAVFVWIVVSAWGTVYECELLDVGLGQSIANKSRLLLVERTVTYYHGENSHLWSKNDTLHVPIYLNWSLINCIDHLFPPVAAHNEGGQIK